MKKLMGAILTALVAIPLLLSGGSFVKADDSVTAPDPKNTEQTVTIDLHKLLFEQGKTPEQKDNNGLEIPSFGVNSTALNGAEFTMYDVSTEYNRLLSEGKTAKEAVEAIQSGYTNFQTTALGTQTTAGEGVASFEGVKLADGTNFKAYLFVETKVPSGVTEKAIPLVIAMPVYNGDVAFMEGNSSNGKDLSTINLYPKNEEKELVTKKKDDTTLSYSVGETIGYTVTVNVPGDAQSLFQVTDTPSTGLQTLVDDNFTVKDGDKTLVKDTDYTVTLNASGGYTLTLSNPKEYVGKELVIKYNMMVTSAAPVDQGMVNKVSVDTDTKKGNEPDTPTPEVFTGGYNFIKQDANSKAGLAGVKFEVKDESDNLLSFKLNASNEWVLSDTTDGATTTIKSQADGKLSVTGLKTGNYTLIETATVDGYVLPDNPKTAFSVVTNEDGHGTYTSTKENETKILNVKKGVLPSTGGTGIYAFLAIGAALMIGAIIWYKKSHDTANV
ncbi:SpaH/EbpB family LPXTG-anchored major pilin [Enterococcus italicus]|uniref:SpaH/EbpB family LPXTG-anchored major pilin n=1 Tax=Enterococcus italicus TaxID=246144 RepID=UPI002072D658|nr:SpaH/EbpB family LPXTG-anchored major pilin [Enterococcus italicus]MCM6932251.1 SpaH/EbpB family LPXTG-anchored major pilin [Enterococcus italicus]